jgi:hypothetical protein
VKALPLHADGVMKAFVVAALLLAACAPVATAPGVRLHAEAVSPGTVRLTLDNGTDAQIGYNLCASGLQRRDGSAWTPVETGDVCTMELRTLNPGADATFEKQLPASLPSGEYRYVTNVESPLGSAQTGVASNSFTR